MICHIGSTLSCVCISNTAHSSMCNLVFIDMYNMAPKPPWTHFPPGHLPHICPPYQTCSLWHDGFGGLAPHMVWGMSRGDLSGGYFKGEMSQNHKRLLNQHQLFINHLTTIIIDFDNKELLKLNHIELVISITLSLLQKYIIISSYEYLNGILVRNSNYQIL